MALRGLCSFVFVFPMPISVEYGETFLFHVSCISHVLCPVVLILISYISYKAWYFIHMDYFHNIRTLRAYCKYCDGAYDLWKMYLALFMISWSILIIINSWGVFSFVLLNQIKSYWNCINILSFQHLNSGCNWTIIIV